MTSPKATFKFQDYKGILPYASELFGVYQPLLGWKSKRNERRFALGAAVDHLSQLEELSLEFSPTLSYDLKRDAGLHLVGFEPGRPAAQVTRSPSLLLTALRKNLQARYADRADQLTDGELSEFLSLPAMTKTLQDNVIGAVNAYLLGQPAGKAAQTAAMAAAPAPSTTTPAAPYTVDDAKATMAYEARLAASMVQLSDARQFTALRNLLFPTDWKQIRSGARAALNSSHPLLQYVPRPSDPLDKMDPNFDLDRIALSPIGIVHLFRQYFFELDTFLGSPVGHVWCSPGTSLELIEVSTRKQIVERTLEQATDSTKKSEMGGTEEDELSDAIKQDNQQDIKFGASVTASYVGVTATSNFDMHNTQKQARESVHKHMRQQSSKLSTEIKTSFKTTFKSVTETSDLASKRYVISNDSSTLQNYELRRKMRQVAVQVQDVGSYLCWQTFVDTPGDALELSTMIHIAEPADLGSIPHPDEPVALEPIAKDYPVDFQYQSLTTNCEQDVVFYYGNDQESDPDINDAIVWQRVFVLPAPKLGYTLDPLSLQVASLHSAICVPHIEMVENSGTVNVWLSQVDFADMPSVKLQISASWTPPPQTKALAQYQEKMAEYTYAKARAQKEAFYKAMRERVTLASRIAPRPADDLREEERITIYRQLIQEMLLPKAYRAGGSASGQNLPLAQVEANQANRHVLSELIASIFDVDKMLYFVAPEWWTPRERATQNIGLAGHKIRPRIPTNADLKEKAKGSFELDSANKKIDVADQIGWDNAKGAAAPHYFITEQSASAKLGSSLGWRMQLDGDDQRNAFLNAPWVKAVMPIRPGKEKAAINWLKHVEGFNGITKADIYTGEGSDDLGKPMHGKPMTEVLDILAASVTKKHGESMQAKPFDLTDPTLPHDPDSVVTSTPIDRVWEHGFNPLAGGFQARPLDSGEPNSNGSAYFQTFDQWVEILPTDQVVPVAVEYDPRTGRLKMPAL
ncbi:hypothetical protein [Massilia sp. YIM B04103]|uniref:hypothetical protein n=1 Tax=Massilia sp. YIM B04103 TaxID=2963106 RepID=UPI0021098460|nr:hypothetical protein [Massilia sp. YIM B04103]